MIKNLSWVIHVILVGLLIGLAAGAKAEGLRPLICYPLNALSAATSLSFLVRLFLTL